MLLCFYAFYDRGEMWSIEDVNGPDTIRDAIAVMLNYVRAVIPRNLGNGWNFPKFHEILHLPQAVDKFGHPMNFDAGTGEHHLKYTAKKPAETSQQIDPKEFQSQVSRRMGDAQSLSKGNQVWETLFEEDTIVSDVSRQSTIKDGMCDYIYSFQVTIDKSKLPADLSEYRRSGNHGLLWKECFVSEPTWYIPPGKTNKVLPCEPVKEAIYKEVASNTQHRMENSMQQVQRDDERPQGALFTTEVKVYGGMVLDLYKDRDPPKTVSHPRFDDLRERGVSFRAMTEYGGQETSGWYDWCLTLPHPNDYDKYRGEECYPHDMNDPKFGEPKEGQYKRGAPGRQAIDWYPAKTLAFFKFKSMDRTQETERVILHCAESRVKGEESVITIPYLMKYGKDDSGQKNVPILQAFDPRKVIKDRVYVVEHNNGGKFGIDLDAEDPSQRVTVLLDRDTYWAKAFVDLRNDQIVAST
jgi:hypothetical protein